jgi:hypothetical protein
MIKLEITIESKDDTSFSVVQIRVNKNANWREEQVFRLFRDATGTVAEKLIAMTNGSGGATHVIRQAEKEHKIRRQKKGKQ